MNPHLQTVTGQMGSPEFDPKDWHDGMSLKIPERWVEGGMMHGPAGSVGVTHVWSRKLPRSKNTSGPTFTANVPTMQRAPHRQMAQASKPFDPRSLTFSGTTWYSRWPNNNYTAIAYISQRIAAFLNNSSTEGDVQEWLLQWPQVNAFWEDAEAYKRSTGPRFFSAPEGFWFARGEDVQVLGAASEMMRKGIGPAHEYKRTLEDKQLMQALLGSTGVQVNNTNRKFRKFAPVQDDPWSRRARNPYLRRFGLAGPEEDIGKKEEMEGGGAGYSGSGTCNLAPMDEVKPYEFLVEYGDTLTSIAKHWLGKENVTGTTLYTARMLQRANVYRLYSDCSTVKKMQIRIPAKWPACPADWADRRVNPDGTAWTDAEPPAPGDVPGGSEGIDRVNVSEDGDSSTLLLVLAAAAAIGGGILLYNSQKKKRR
jgi:hypothetical protein